MVVSEARRVGVLARRYQRHIVIVDQIVEELREELGQPPHTNEVPSCRVVLPFPAVLFAFIALFLVVLSVELDNFSGDLLVDAAI